MAEPALQVPATSGTHDAGSWDNPCFIGDLHLWPWRPHACMRFASFLKREARQFDSLFILGDLFEFWVGDDAMGPGRLVAWLLARYAKTGRGVYLMQGNRDFSLGNRFAELAGGTLLAQQSVVTVKGRRILISHGDEWCLLDHDYQAFRALVRDPAWQAKALSMSVFERVGYARSLRAKSTSAKKAKTMEQMDVVVKAVDDCARSLNCSAVIHGHTHRPAEHRDEPIPRFVVPNWELDGPKKHYWGWVSCDDTGMPQLVLKS